MSQIQIQIPIPNKYLLFGYKGLVFCRINGWLMGKHGQGTHITKIRANKSAKKPTNAPKLFGPICLSMPKSLGFSKKKAISECPEFVGWVLSGKF